MAWDQEWQEIKAAVREREPASTQLNQLAPGGGGGSSPDQVTSPARNKAASEAINKHLEPYVKDHGNDAEESTKTAVKEFGPRDGDGWDTAAGLKKAHATWKKQVTALRGRLLYEANGLLKTSIDLRNDDIGIAAGMRPKSNIDSL
ncbi:hypothetical protein [Streptomyces sp. PTY087I2]|uniref:hypothetical protein n=1 Tax=Streptomyces sp. PTY087I2 TaxID=1819298 RepID=UPI00080BB826|nr:hypothetical protein [Streptomyces sp. PTY087I2]OCC09347.1 hypothetical protein A3Q37_04701 [Streptomyces sp. PTY087I2]